ncbi:hypothetical protein HDU96_008855 [Phlyctochytrium bullatum]|nr:hypothetical protein HDU96_008855 [Phlyctochytrium bullatum]
MSTGTGTGTHDPLAIYTSHNIIANAMRSICIGYSLSVWVSCGLIMHFINKRGAYLPIISATFLFGFNVACIAIDVLRLPCRGRAVSIYVFSYLSQICLEIYQTNKMRILACRHPAVKVLAYLLFAVRAGSLIAALFFYYDITTSEGLCATGYPFLALLIEKFILLFYNLGNLGLLFHIVRKTELESKGVMHASQVLHLFLFQDGLTFVLAIILDTIFILIVSFVATSWIFSMTAGLANGFNLFILHVKYCTSLKARVLPMQGGIASPVQGTKLKSRQQSLQSGAGVAAGGNEVNSAAAGSSIKSAVVQM